MIFFQKCRHSLFLHISEYIFFTVRQHLATVNTEPSGINRFPCHFPLHGKRRADISNGLLLISALGPAVKIFTEQEAALCFPRRYVPIQPFLAVILPELKYAFPAFQRPQDILCQTAFPAVNSHCHILTVRHRNHGEYRQYQNHGCRLQPICFFSPIYLQPKPIPIGRNYHRPFPHNISPTGLFFMQRQNLSCGKQTPFRKAGPYPRTGRQPA